MALLDWLIIFVFFLLNLVLGFWASRNIKHFGHFAVGARSFSAFAIFATLSASFIGGGYTLGNAEKVFREGLIYAIALTGFSLKEILVGLVLAPKMGRFKSCYSIGDIVASTYGKSAKIVTGIFAVIVCAGILGAQFSAMGKIIDTFFPIPPYIGVLLGFGIIILYCSFGGMRAVVYTDILQFLILVTAIPALFFIGLHKVGGWDEVVRRTPESFTNPFSCTDFWPVFIPLFFTFMLGEAAVPPYTQRLMMAKDPTTTQHAVIASGVLSMPFFVIVGALGLIALIINPGIDPNQAIPYLVSVLLVPGLKGIVVIGLISVLMSSASGFLNAAAISAIHDVVKPLANDRITLRQGLIWARISTLLIGILSLWFAFSFQNVIDVLIYAYNFWSPVVLVPLIAAILGLPVTLREFWAGALTGLLVTTITSQYQMLSPWLASPVALGVAANAIAVFGSWLLRRCRLNRAYSSYE